MPIGAAAFGTGTRRQDGLPTLLCGETIQLSRDWTLIGKGINPQIDSSASVACPYSMQSPKRVPPTTSVGRCSGSIRRSTESDQETACRGARKAFGRLAEEFITEGP